jgi:hypothetical protein
MAIDLTLSLLTYSMEQSPSWEANWFAASQEVPRVFWNPKVPHRTHKRPLPVPSLSQPNPVHTPTSHFLKVHPNTILPSTPRSPQWSLSFRFPHPKPCTHPSPRPYAVHAPPISFFSILSPARDRVRSIDHPLSLLRNKFGKRVNTVKWSWENFCKKYEHGIKPGKG